MLYYYAQLVTVHLDKKIDLQTLFQYVLNSYFHILKGIIHKKNGRFQLKTTIFNIEKVNNLEIVIKAETNIERLFERCRRQCEIIHQ